MTDFSGFTHPPNALGSSSTKRVATPRQSVTPKKHITTRSSTRANAAPVAPGDDGNQTKVHFSHPSALVGSMTIETGIEVAQWGYNLNTRSFPTYGGEVVQIHSIYIDDLMIGGTVSTYSQMEAIYSYFAAYMQIATQGKNPTPAAGDSAYNLEPMHFTYAHRGWDFDIYPLGAPGFRYGNDVVTPSWSLSAHIIDDSVNLNPIKAQITNSIVAAGLGGLTNLNDEISPNAVDPNNNPFMSFDGSTTQAGTALGGNADYFNSLVSAYQSGNFDSLTGIASAPTSLPSQSTPTPKTQKGHPIPKNQATRTSS